ncbi:MAG TPA: hypothetical protein VGN97_18820 [Mesorhizobium sp.]|nr:hypothetical protein [Mesorhizobium sp.]
MEKLNSLFETFRRDLARRHQTVLDQGVDAAARLAGVKLAPRASALEELGPGQMKAFEAAAATLLNLIVVGSAGMAPNFKKLQAETVEKLRIGEWRIVETSGRHMQRSASVRAMDEIIRDKGDMAFKLFEPEAIVQTKQSHADCIVRLLKDAEAAEETTVQDWFLENRHLPASLIHFRWRDVRRGAYTYFDLHLFLEEQTERIAQATTLSEVIWRCLRGNYKSGAYWGGFAVAGHIFNGGRDGLGVDFVGVTAAAWLRKRLGEIGLPPYAARISAELNERML